MVHRIFNLINKLESKIPSMNKESGVTICLYTSLEYLMRKPWFSLIVKMIKNSVLMLV